MFAEGIFKNEKIEWWKDNLEEAGWDLNQMLS